VAIQYAERFGRSAPEWYSVPQLLSRPTPSPQRRTGVRDGSLWACPPLLDASAVARLAASQSGRDIRLVNWAQLKTLGLDAVKPLSALFTQWSTQRAKMMFDGLDVLNAVLEADTPVKDSQVPPERWLLRLEALRLQGLSDEYETIALNYCVTFEVSPPSWTSPTSICDSIAPEAWASSTLPGWDDALDTVPAGLSSFGYFDELALKGELLGDAAAAIEQVMAKVHPGDPIVINCQNLIRVDFVAAGHLLNWLAVHESANLLVQFVNVPRLVSVLFQDMGISEFAEVSVALN
jgi:ABC-type transporter Mla MlaB component